MERETKEREKVREQLWLSRMDSMTRWTSMGFLCGSAHRSKVKGYKVIQVSVVVAVVVVHVVNVK